MDKLVEYQAQLKGLEPMEILNWAVSSFGPKKVSLASSFGAEDQILTHLVGKMEPKPRVFTLDTGRLYEETYTTMEKSRWRYKISYEVYHPMQGAVETLLQSKGPFSFKESVENRKECCGIRKVEPLGRALNGLSAWITGLRKEQSVTRESLAEIEWDEAHGIYKVNPLIHWDEAKVWEFVKENSVTYNPLHDQKFPSIGCEPCTRAVAEGEDIRAGRWWWEHPDHKECGLHIKAR